MKRIIDDIGSGRHTRVYICTEEEYNDLLEQYKDHKNTIEEDSAFGTRYITNHIQVHRDVDYEMPRSILNLDGFTSIESRTFKAKALEVLELGHYCTGYNIYTTESRIKANTYNR